MTATVSTQHQSRQRPTWEKATWEEYVQIRDHHEVSDAPRVKLFFHDSELLVDDMGWEGIDHSEVRELILFLLFCLLDQYPQRATCLGGCLLDKEGLDAASPDLVLYLGEDYPKYKKGGPRRIDLNRWRVPDLVGEVADTTLASDLDQKKRLYASLGISEYWVISVQDSQVFFFYLNEHSQYERIEVSKTLPKLNKTLLEVCILKLDDMTNMEVARWFQQQLPPVNLSPVNTDA